MHRPNRAWISGAGADPGAKRAFRDLRDPGSAFADPGSCAGKSVRGVRELAELARDEVGGLLADVDGVVADPLEAARDEDHPKPPLPRLLVAADLEQAVDDAAVGAVDQLVQVEQRLR